MNANTTALMSNTTLTMSSVEIAALTKKRYDNIMNVIESLIVDYVRVIPVSSKPIGE